ncbi:MAG: hypothetical protein PVH00_10115 [Gemmatimonadota bacterium]|jgi:hypothetical protein
MSKDSRRQADERLGAALAGAAAADRRDDFRDRLRRLKRDNAPEFRRMTEHYEQVVLPDLLASPDPLRVWIEFGVTLGGTAGPGRVAAIDDTGRSGSWTGEYVAGQLLLWLPDDRQADALPLMVPVEPSAAQEATLDLLVRKKLAL